MVVTFHVGLDNTKLAQAGDVPVSETLYIFEPTNQGIDAFREKSAQRLPNVHLVPQMPSATTGKRVVYVANEAYDYFRAKKKKLRAPWYSADSKYLSRLVPNATAKETPVNALALKEFVRTRKVKKVDALDMHTLSGHLEALQGLGNHIISVMSGSMTMVYNAAGDLVNEEELTKAVRYLRRNMFTTLLSDSKILFTRQPLPRMHIACVAAGTVGCEEDVRRLCGVLAEETQVTFTVVRPPEQRVDGKWCRLETLRGDLSLLPADGAYDVVIRINGELNSHDVVPIFNSDASTLYVGKGERAFDCMHGPLELFHELANIDAREITESIGVRASCRPKGADGLPIVRESEIVQHAVSKGVRVEVSSFECG